MQIGKHLINKNSKAFIVAELSANHNHNYDLAEKTIIAAKNAGADAIKLQTYTPDTITIDCKNEPFILKDSIWKGKSLYELYQSAYTPWEWHTPLKELTESLNMEFFSSPFDPTAVDFLHKLNVSAYKIASFEIFDIPLIEYTAGFNKPIIISTGMADLASIDEAVQACRRAGNNDIILLKCTSAYPATVANANLATIPHMRDLFNVEVGLSDHTEGVGVSAAAVALGAKLVEKHFILDRSLGGPDASFSMMPDEFRTMVDIIRNVEQSVGVVNYMPPPETVSMRKIARSLFIVKDIKAGECITSENVRSIRPGDGLHPRYLNDIIGKTARKDLKKGTPVSWDILE